MIFIKFKLAEVFSALTWSRYPANIEAVSVVDFEKFLNNGALCLALTLYR